jgi:hypothetical protein
MIDWKSFFPLCLFLLASPIAFGAPSPGPVPGSLEPELDLRVFARHERVTGLLELSGRAEAEGRQPRSATIGAYYRLLGNLRAGLFYQRKNGERHDGDWQKSGDNWQWVDPNGRGENIFIADATPRFELGGNWLVELRGRIFFDTTAKLNTIKFRPGVTYFWLDGGEPFLNFFLQYEASFPLNYGKSGIYEKWAYLGVLKPIDRNFQFGIYGALKWVSWTSDSVFEGDNGGKGFTAEALNPVLGLVGIYQFDL